MMKKIAFLLLPAVIGMMAAGCARLEPETPTLPVEEEEILISKSFRADAMPTRTTLDGVNLEFSKGESLSIWDGSGNREYTADEAGASVSFSGEVSASATAFYALTPYSAETVFSKSGSSVTASTTLPSAQEAVAGTFADGLYIAAGQSDTDDSFLLDNVLSVAKVTLAEANLAGHAVTSIALTSAAYPLAGDVTVTYGETCSAAAGSSSSNTVTLSKSDGSALEDGVYYFVLLPNAGGQITLKFTASDGYIATKTATLKSAFEAGSIKNLGTVKGLEWEAPKYYFEKVTTFPGAGTYLIVVENDGNLLAMNPVDGEYAYPKTIDVTDLLQGGFIVMDDLNNAFEFATASSGYSIQQLSDSRYLYQDGSYNTISPSTAVSQYYSVTASSGTFKITNTTKNKFLQYRTGYSSFGSYSSSQSDGILPCLYRLTIPEPHVTTLATTDITVSSGVLHAEFANLGTTNVQDAHFVWGTSSGQLTHVLEAEDFDVTTGSFQATLGSLEENTTIYYQAVLQYCTDGVNYIPLYGEVLSFTTQSSSTGGNKGLQWLGCYEMPAINLVNENSYSGTGQETFGSTYWYNYETTNSMQKVITHTYSYNNVLYRNYTALVDGDKRCPLWTAYPMHSVAYPDNGVGRVGSFSTSTSYDRGIPQAWQSSGSTSDYNNGNGYARGHHCASADRQATEDANKQTFYYTNQSPQWQNSFNGGVWETLEEDIRDNLVPSGRDTLYIVVGTLFEDGNTGSSNDGGTVARPSHFYKLLMLCSFNASGTMTDAKGAAFLFTNAAHPNASYSSFLKTINDIEDRTGFDFFVNVPSDLQEAAESTDDSLW